MIPEQALVDRFASDLNMLASPGVSIGVAVSGGPDSVALLLLSAAVRPGRVEAATVDHALRSDSRAEADMVARVCDSIGVPHRILTAAWEETPKSAIQERARTTRYCLLADWADERQLDTLLTGHHLDDQAETLLMRLARGAGVKGLGGIRPVGRVPGRSLPLIRPLLQWRHSELEAICASAGIQPVHDPSNDDPQFERVRIRRALEHFDWLDAGALASSAANLADADAGLDWAADHHWKEAVSENDDGLVYRAADAPSEIQRRIIRRAILSLATEGDAELRGRELDHLLPALHAGRQATIRGVLCTGGQEWRFTRAPSRRMKRESPQPIVDR